MKISIIICDDEDLFREGLHLLIEKNGQYKVLGEADNGQDLLELLSGLSRQGVTADLVLMDVEMPVMKGTDAARRVREISPSTRIIGLSAHMEPYNIIAGFSNGFDAYLLKDTVFEEVHAAIKIVFKGEKYLSPALADKVVFNHIIKDLTEDSPLKLLSEREKAVLRFIGEEKSPKEIAFALDISRKTVDIHKKNIMRRLGIKTFAGLIKFCIRYLQTD